MRGRELVVDLFAGGGGASLGIRDAIGRDPDMAINHDAVAVAVHAANHPTTRHLHGDVWHYAPRDVVGGDSVGLLWASPTCTFFSRAKGGPLDVKAARKIRSLASVVVRWARDVRPRLIIIENVEAFQQWGPLLHDGKPCPVRKGKNFRSWVGKLRALGYVVEWRELRACDFGAPTSRKRLFIIARCDGHPIVWPAPTHGCGLLPYMTTADCIDWSIPCPSIFGRKKPLAEATMRRIARGVRKFVLEAERPFVVGAVSPSLVHVSNGERKGQAPRIYDIQKPLGTVVAGGVKHALVTASADGDRREEVRAFITKYYGDTEAGARAGQSPRLPLDTITTANRFGLVVVHDQVFDIRDIGMRMLEPRELARAQGFPDDFVIDTDVYGNRVSKTAQIRLVGNSVASHVASALVRANLDSIVGLAA